MFLIRFLPVFLLLHFTSALAEPTDRYEELTGEQDDYEVVGKNWIESGSKVPPMPQQGDWSPVRMDSLPENQHAYIDMHSLRLNRKDYVVRYWLLIRSNGGGFSATFEGMRCATGEYIIYAYGYKDREPPLRKLSLPKWRRISKVNGFNYRAELQQDVICAGETPRSERQIGQAVKGLFEQHNPQDNWSNDD